MMVAMLILRMIPELEIFELFGQKAQLRKRIDEADEVFANLRKLATAISKPVAKTTAWSNWLGGMSWEEKLLLEDDTTWFELTEWIELHKEGDPEEANFFNTNTLDAYKIPDQTRSLQ